MRNSLSVLFFLLLSMFLSPELLAVPIAAGMNTDDSTIMVGTGNTMGAVSVSPSPTLIADANYLSVCDDQVISYTAITAARTVTLTPCGTPTKLKLRQIKDVSGSVSPTLSIILASTSGLFDGLTSTAISEARGSKTFYDDGTNFFMMGAFLPSVNASALIQKADGNGGLMNAISGTDYVIPSALSAYATTASLATVATTGAYSDLTGKPSIPAAQVNSDWNAVSGLAQILNKPTIPVTTRATSPLTLSLVGTGATGTQISSTKDSSVCVTVSTSTTSTIGGPSTSVVMMKTFSSNSATEGNWVLQGQSENDQTITLAVVLQSAQVVKGQICADVPAGYYVKIENSGTGTHTEVFVIGFQTIYG